MSSVVEARGLTKRYGGVVACDQVSLAVNEKEVVAIVGDNGAGKSTLVKMLSGAVRPDAGEIFVADEAVEFHQPLDARESGIETIYQDLALAQNLDVAANIFMGREIRKEGILGFLGVLDRKRMRQDAGYYLQDLDIKIPMIEKLSVEMMSGGQRQSVAIARAARWAKRLLIMDEPTAALGVKQSAAVLELIQRVKERGTSVLMISHNMPDVLDVSDRVVVMLRGRKVKEVETSEVSHERLVALITGAERADDFE